MASITIADDIKKLGTILGVWAHPDDETFTSAGIMAAAVKNGQKVICVTATKGETGVQDESRWPASRLAEIREYELHAALDVIGVSQLHFLNYRDGSCLTNNQDAVDRVMKLIDQYKPDTILTFGKDGLTGHPDHRAVCEWALMAAQNSITKPVVYHAVATTAQYEQGMADIDRALNYFYNVPEPRLAESSDCDVYFELAEDLEDLKYEALKQMPSQYSKLLEMFSKESVCGAFSTEAFIRSQ